MAGKDVIIDYLLAFVNGVDTITNAIRKGHVDGVKGSFGGVHVLVEKTGISVEKMVSKEGKNSDGWSRTPLQSAAWKEQLEIVQYLVKTCLWLIS